MSYDPQVVRDLYDACVEKEWERFDSPLGRVQLTQIQRFLARHVCPKSKVLDAASGPGRFAMFLAKMGCEVTLVDISEKMIAEAQRRLGEADLSDRIAGAHCSDIVNMGFLPDKSFDVVLCLGGALCYLRDQVQTALGELVRVCKPDGLLLGSVMSRIGTLRTRLVYGWARSTNVDAEALGILLRTGDVPPGGAFFTEQPAHFFRKDELLRLLDGAAVDVVEVRSTNALLTLSPERILALQSESSIWPMLEDIEAEVCLSAAELGSHILFASRPGKR
ncbi:MAG: class I SAM-dependent methyltransferase [Armatimonadota bacterium]|nr:MAG: class I SAM-dependent methyltransferase [Armatimonadota bacterium]